MKKLYLGFFIIIVLLFTSNSNFTFAQTYATLPFVEHFDNDWVNYKATRDVPSLFWSNSILTGDNSWSRDDDGVLRGAWTDLLGSYTPTGANNTTHSARFHSYHAFDQGSLDLKIDFSSLNGNKYLTFNYINVSGLDSLEVLLSIDGGNSFYKYKGVTIQPHWFKYVVNLGNVTSKTAILRFKAFGDNAFSDIGLDEINVSGPLSLVANFNADQNVIHTIPGVVKFHDLSSGNPTSWAWDFNNDGIIDDITQNPTFSYSLPGTYSVKLVVSNGTTTDSILFNHLVSVYSKLVVPFTENFENEWINFSDIRDVPSESWKNCPATGANSWSRDDDGLSRGAWDNLDGSYSPAGANGTNHSARFHTSRTHNPGKLEANIDFSQAGGDKTLTFYYINPSGLDSLEIFLAPSPGSPFIKISGQKTSADWKLITINLGNISYTNAILRFSVFSEYKLDDMGIDEISISGVGTSTNLKADFYSNIVKSENSLTAQFIDISGNNPTSWSWDFDNDGIVDATTQNPIYTFTKPGLYNVKLSVTNGTSSDVIVKNGYIKVTGFGSLPFYENFDHSWISVDDSIDVPSLFWKNSPATGINSWSRDDQGLSRKAWWDNYGNFNTPGAKGTSNSARFHSFDANNGQQGILDLKIDFSKQPFSDTLRFAYNNFDGTDSLDVFLSKDNGISFSKIGNYTTASTWMNKQICLGDISSKEAIIRFISTSDNLGSDIGIDEIYVNGVAGNIIKSFTIPGQTGNSEIDELKHSIIVNMPFVPSVSSLIASYILSVGATSKVGDVTQVSGTTTNDFTNGVTYNVSSADGITVQDWLVTVNVAKNIQTEIISFSILGQIGVSEINSSNHTVSINVPFETNVPSLAGTFVLSYGATAKVGTIAQTSGTTLNDFTNTVLYTITAEDGSSTQAWSITLNVAKNNKTEIITFEIPDQIGVTNVNTVDHTITIKISSLGELNSIISTFTLSAGASAKIGNTVQISGTTSNNFAGIVNYIITAADGTSTQTWAVTISKAEAIGLIFNETDVNVYPNPSNGLFNVKVTDAFKGKISIEVFDLKGLKVISFETDKNNTDEPVLIDLNAYPAGLYNVIIKKADKVIRLKLNKI